MDKTETTATERGILDQLTTEWVDIMNRDVVLMIRHLEERGLVEIDRSEFPINSALQIGEFRARLAA